MFELWTIIFFGKSEMNEQGAHDDLRGKNQVLSLYKIIVALHISPSFPCGACET